MQLSRSVIDALMPRGSAWTLEDDEGFDQLLNGIALNASHIRESLAGLARTRNPLLTSILHDLEREYGTIPDDSMDEQVRRQRLAAVQSARQGNGSADYLQSQLQQSGFDVQVHVNNPPIDPSLFILFAGASITGNEDALFGREGAMFAAKRGELLVNGPVYDNQELVRYAIPPSQYWPLVFFIGGNSSRDDTGALTDITDATVPISRKGEFIRLIVKYKPMHAWAGLLIRYT